MDDPNGTNHLVRGGESQVWDDARVNTTTGGTDSKIISSNSICLLNSSVEDITGLIAPSVSECERLLCSINSLIDEAQITFLIEEVVLSELFSQRSKLLSSLGYFADAVASARKSIAICPLAESYYHLGIALYCLTDYAGALDVFALGLSVDPANEPLKRANIVTLARLKSRKDRRQFIGLI